MQYSVGSVGRVFTLRLGDGDRLPDCLEAFAAEQRVQVATVMYVGGSAGNSKVVVGPRAGTGEQVIPQIYTLEGAREVLAVGTIFPDESGVPVLHMHGALGRDGGATVGCMRAGVDVWLVGEVVITEILGADGRRKKDSRTGFQLLEFPDRQK